MKSLTVSLLLLVAISTLNCQGSGSSSNKVDRLLQMRQKHGWPTASSGLNIYAMADCSGPSSVFQTLVISGSTETRFEQKSGSRHILGVNRPDSAWMHDFAGDTTVAVDDATICFLINHELHAIAFYPEKRYGQWAEEKDTIYYSEGAKMLTFLDIKGGRVKIFYEEESWRPLGFSIENHLGRGAKQVDVLFENWQEWEGRQVFTEARFLQGEDVYRYKFTEISFGELSDDAFNESKPIILP
ncbi:MAG: hypothetical protein HEP71_14935 [Roseivirga sp.]|nr:hypothetical protein [Roseivirga sp.]